MRSLEQVNIRTNVRTYVLTYIRTGQTLYPLHNFVVRGDKKIKCRLLQFLFGALRVKRFFYKPNIFGKLHVWVHLYVFSRF